MLISILCLINVFLHQQKAALACVSLPRLTYCVCEVDIHRSCSISDLLLYPKIIFAVHLCTKRSYEALLVTMRPIEG